MQGRDHPSTTCCAPRRFCCWWQRWAALSVSAPGRRRCRRDRRTCRFSPLRAQRPRLGRRLYAWTLAANSSASSWMPRRARWQTCRSRSASRSATSSRHRAPCSSFSALASSCSTTVRVMSSRPSALFMPSQRWSADLLSSTRSCLRSTWTRRPLPRRLALPRRQPSRQRHACRLCTTPRRSHRMLPLHLPVGLIAPVAARPQAKILSDATRFTYGDAHMEDPLKSLKVSSQPDHLALLPRQDLATPSLHPTSPLPHRSAPPFASASRPASHPASHPHRASDLCSSPIRSQLAPRGMGPPTLVNLAEVRARMRGTDAPMQCSCDLLHQRARRKSRGPSASSFTSHAGHTTCCRSAVGADHISDTLHQPLAALRPCPWTPSRAIGFAC